MGRLFKVFFVLIFLALIGSQFIEVERTNPEVTADLKAPAKVKRILHTACYDCHSNETKWPWYSYVAPVSWMVIRDVEEGRESLNFSTWGKIASSKKAEYKKEIWEEVNEEKMPLEYYIYTHPNAKLDVTQKKTLKEWAEKQSAWE
ncbi:MAG: heme-binding domain-containing protein [Ignavibacteriales bacterium]|nr:heme-binding domain-containing protein [Ignavibacteriales bacterium]